MVAELCRLTSAAKFDTGRVGYALALCYPTLLSAAPNHPSLKAAKNGEEKSLVAAGALMYAAHESYRDNCKLSVPEGEDRYEVRRIVKARFPVEVLKELRDQLQNHVNTRNSQ